MTRFARKMRDRFAAAAMASGWLVHTREHLLQATKQGSTVNLSFGDNGNIAVMSFNHQSIPTPAIEGLVPLLFDMQEA